MYLIDRAVAIIKPKQPFLNWLQRMPDPPDALTLEELRRDSTAILIPESECREDAEAYIHTIAPHLFEMELDSWYRDRKLWPPQRDYRLFSDWFDVEIYEMVLDAAEDEITREAY